MRIGIGNGGWVVVDDLGLPGPLYVRMRDQAGRLRICELYIDADRGDAIDARDLRELPLSSIEAFINSSAEKVRERQGAPSPDISTFATYISTTFGAGAYKGGKPANWVAASFQAQSAEATRVGPSQIRNWTGIREDEREYRLSAGPVDGLTDEFLREVAKAYGAAVARGERPNVAIAEQTGYTVKTVQRWVYTARQRGLMPRGSKGRVG